MDRGTAVVRQAGRFMIYGSIKWLEKARTSIQREVDGVTWVELNGVGRRLRYIMIAAISIPIQQSQCSI